MFIYRYNIINQSIAPVDAIASPQDDSFAPTQYASGLYFLQENLKDQWVDAIQPLGMDAQLIADWNQIMNVAKRSYYMNVHNVVAAMALVGLIIHNFYPHVENRWVNYRIGGASGTHQTVVEFNDSTIQKFPTASPLFDDSSGLNAYDLPSVNGSNVPASVTSFLAAYEQMLSVSPTIAQVRAYLINLGIPYFVSQILGYMQMSGVLSDPNGYQDPFFKQLADYVQGNAAENAFIKLKGFGTEMQTLGQFDITMQNAAEDQLVMQYAAGNNDLAEWDASQALAQMNTVQQDMYNFAGQLNAFVHDPTAPADLQSQLQKENTVQIRAYSDPALGLPQMIVPPRTSPATSPTYNVKPAIQTLPAQRVGSARNVEITGVPVMPAQTIVHPGGTPGNLGVIHAANISAHTPATAIAEPAVAPTSSHVAAGNVTHRNTPTVSAAAGSQNAASAPAAATPHHVASMGLLVAAGMALLFIL